MSSRSTACLWPSYTCINRTSFAMLLLDNKRLLINVKAIIAKLESTFPFYMYMYTCMYR